MKVPYNLFDKWYRDTRHRIVKVRFDGVPTTVVGDDREESLMDSLDAEGLQHNRRISAETRKQSVPAS